MQHFLLIFDPASDTLRETRTFRRPGPALKAYAEAEAQHQDEPEVQVVLVASDSLETVRVTHGNFFEGEVIEDLMREILASK